MSGRSIGRLVLAVLVALSLSAASIDRAAEAGDGWWGRLDEGEVVSLHDIIAKPRQFRERALTFFCIFRGRNERQLFDPIRTPFNAKRYDNFGIWPDGAPLWSQKSYERYFHFLYIPRRHVQRDDLLRLPPITRIEVTGKIRGLVRGSPCIEVFSFRETGHRIDKEVIRHVIAGDNYARSGRMTDNQLAARRFSQALRPDLPPVYDMRIRKRLVDSLRALGHHEEASRVAHGELVNPDALPERDPGMPTHLPGDLPTGDLPVAGMPDPGATPDEVGFPPPATSGMGAFDGDRPPVPELPGGVDAGSDAPPPRGPAPTNPGPGELPGFAPTAPPLPSGAPAGGTPRVGARGTAPGKRSLRGVPPVRRPRLTGVK